MTARDPAWVEAGAKALGIDFVDPLAVEAVIAAVEPLIRREVLADLRAKVKRLVYPDLRFLEGRDYLRRDAVLALIEEAGRG